MSKQQYIEAGQIVNTHGVAGEVKVEVWLDSPRFFKSFKRVFINGQELAVLSARTQKDHIIAKLEGCDDLNTAMTLKGKTVYIDRNDAALPHGGFFLCDILGARVIDENGNEVGVLTEILERPASNIFVVQGSSEHLIPDVPEFILSADADNGIVTVHLIEGM